MPFPLTSCELSIAELCIKLCVLHSKHTINELIAWWLGVLALESGCLGSNPMCTTASGTEKDTTLIFRFSMCNKKGERERICRFWLCHDEIK